MFPESDNSGLDIEIGTTPEGMATLPLGDVVTGRGFISGKSGSGKSNSASVVVEQVLARGIPLLIVDADGEYVGLKESYEVLHAGVHEACDVRLTPDEGSARTLARAILDRHVPTILDTSEFFDEEAMQEFVADVARHLFHRQKTEQHPLLVVLEECQEFVPQRGGDVKETFVKLAKRGRSRGLGILGISQRPADVDKAFITQADWLAIHRLTWPNDRDVVADLLGREYADASQDLATGESFVVTDWRPAPRRVQWRRKETPDLGAAPSIEKALGSTPDRIDGDVYAEFGAGDEADLPESAAEYLEHLLDTIEDLDTDERYILDYVRAQGPTDPKEGYALAGGDPESNAVFAKYRRLREERLIEKTGKSEYAYALPDRVESQLRFNPEIEDEHFAAIVGRLEAEFAGVADEPAETGPEPVTTGDTLGTYRVHENDGGGYAQLGKPVTEYLDIDAGGTIGVTPTDGGDALVVERGEGEFTYAAFDRGRGYTQCTVGAAAVSALGAEPGDVLRADVGDDGQVCVVVCDLEDGDK